MKPVFAIFLTAVFLCHNLAARADELERKENEERFNRLNGRLDDLEEAYRAQNKRMGTMAEDVNTVLRSMREEQNRMAATYVTHDELKKLYEKLQDVEQKREADKKLILEEIKEIQKLAAKTPLPPPVVPKENPDPKEIKTESTEGYFPYTVQKNDNLTAIIAAYNAELKKQGKSAITFDQVRRANPGMNPNKLLVGHELKIPVPASK